MWVDRDFSAIASLWNSDANDKAPVFCDISESAIPARIEARVSLELRPTTFSGVTFAVGYNYGLPFSHLLLARQLENTTTLRSKSVINDAALKHRRRFIDATLAITVPVVGILLHLSQQVCSFPWSGSRRTDGWIG